MITTSPYSISSTAYRFLRSRLVIVCEIASIAIAGVLGAILPQTGTASSEELASLREHGPLAAALVQTFSLDHIFLSTWFLALVLLATASLLILVIEQAKRLRSQWSRRLSPAHFQEAPLRVDFERQARMVQAEGSLAPQIKIWTERRLGSAGSAIFHGGLLLLIVAGTLRALFGVNAVVDLIEGETLPPKAQAWAAQWPGVWARPFHLDSPVTLNEVRTTQYDNGDLRDHRVNLAIQSKAGFKDAELAVNRDFSIAGKRLFLDSAFGPAAMLQWRGNGGTFKREAALLAGRAKGVFEGTSAGPNHLQAHLRVFMHDARQRPHQVEVRVMKGNVLLFSGDAKVGETLNLPDGAILALQATPLWARLRGSRDWALWPAYAGFILTMLGATIIFTVIRMDGCRVVTPMGARERVFIALKPQRFSQLYLERFKKIVREEGGLTSEDEFLQPVDQSVEKTGAPQPALAVKQADRIYLNSILAPPVTVPATNPRIASGLAMLFCMTALTSCNHRPLAEARQLVERYNQVVSEAYRRGDARLIEPVVGPNEGKKLTGLIGVRLDLGITLDSQLLSLELIRVENKKDEMCVYTKERWRYRDLKIGSGRQVGEESLDSYMMLYRFKRYDKAWLMDEIRFTDTPQVGRKQTPWLAAHAEPHKRQGHGIETKEPQP